MKKLLFIIMAIFFAGCKTNINYYQGFIYDMNNKPVKNLKVYEKSDKNNYSITNEKGYFKIPAKNNNINRFLYVEQNDLTIIDSIQVFGSQGGEKIKYNFVEGQKDTLYIKFHSQVDNGESHP
ncbi:hypothetical protein LVD15_24865 [Fulvivirga maritima]|uniref:hypothetical protein n=1 Tax=Fulvivirga maritima TaxID=2904247 RepID=UPI001F2C5D9F|nr:hypothetical protein [Fulvivirga maritima]UII26489.1 hypothetical protein LVD15_24865 [Fulvivirga maritima]